MKISKELLKAAGIVPRLRLGNKSGNKVVSTGPHRVKILADKIVTGFSQKHGKDIEYVRYLVEEAGEKKRYQTPKLNDNGEISYLVQRLAEVEEGQEVILEMKKRGIKSYVSVTPIGEEEAIEHAPDDDGGEDTIQA